MSVHELESVSWTGRYKLVYAYKNGKTIEYICCVKLNKVGHFNLLMLEPYLPHTNFVSF